MSNPASGEATNFSRPFPSIDMFLRYVVDGETREELHGGASSVADVVMSPIPHMTHVGYCSSVRCPKVTYAAHLEASMRIKLWFYAR